MNKLLAWAGVFIAIWALTTNGHKSFLMVMMILAYIAIVVFITFKGGGSSIPKINIDEDFSQPKAG